MKIKKVPCLEARYGEFGDLLFGQSEDGMTYFNATGYIKAKGDVRIHNIKTFEIGFAHWISATCDAYSIAREDVIAIEQDTGEVLIDESLAIMFVSYIEPDFGVWLMERMSEMLINGIALSDTCIMIAAKHRFGKDDISKILQV